MKNNHTSETSEDPSTKENELLVSDIFKDLFKYQGIEFASVALIHWKVVEDKIIPQPVNTLREIAALCGDGNYHIAIKNAVISGIEDEPFETPEINIEVALEDGKWSEPRIYTDFETCSQQSATPEALSERLERVKENFIGILLIASLLLKIANDLRDLFS